MTEAGDRWKAMSARRRGALLRAVRAGEQVAGADRPVAVAIAERELDRLTAVVRPDRVRMWRILHGITAVLFALPAVAAGIEQAWSLCAVFATFAVVFGSSALLARRRLDRQVTRLAAARDLNQTHDVAAQV